jgi:hypothetical protein
MRMEIFPMRNPWRISRKSPDLLDKRTNRFASWSVNERWLKVRLLLVAAAHFVLIRVMDIR